MSAKERITGPDHAAAPGGSPSSSISESIRSSTGIIPAEVDDALRFGVVRGYFDETERGFSVTWPWFRAITLFLTRRHLLFPAGAKG